MESPHPISVAEMRAIERGMEARGISSLQMMQMAGRNAAQALAGYLRQHWPADRPARILFLCGPGNNGGDGLVCAAALFDLATQGQFGNGSIGALTLQVYLLRARKADDPVFQPVREQEIFVADAENDLRWRVFLQLIGHANIIVDAVLGIGTSRPIGSHLKDLHEFGPGGHDMVYGQGFSDVPAILNEFKRQGFTGPISIEYEYKQDNNLPEVTQCVEFVKNFKAK